MRLGFSSIFEGKKGKKFKEVSRFDDFHLKSCSLLQNPSDPSDQVLLKSLTISDPEKADIIIQKIQKLTHPFLVKIMHVDCQQKGDYFQYDVYLSPFNSDLLLEMRERQVERNYFSEEELWDILKSCLKGLAYLHDQELPHGSLSPQMIKLMKNEDEKPEVKILHPMMLELLECEGQIQSEAEEKSYLSPEEFISLKYEETKKYVDYVKADVYCLGLCFLESATFFSIRSCYDWETFLMNYEFILRKLLIIHNRYSKHLAYILKCMLVVDDKSRPTTFEIEALLSAELEETNKRSLYISPMRTKYQVEMNVGTLF